MTLDIIKEAILFIITTICFVAFVGFLSATTDLSIWYSIPTIVSFVFMCFFGHKLTKYS